MISGKVEVDQFNLNSRNIRRKIWRLSLSQNVFVPTAFCRFVIL